MTYKKFAIGVAKKAGKIMLANFIMGMKKEWKADHTPITITDKLINRMVINAVKKSFPEHGVLGEEESYHSQNKEYLWVCDPVDGTIPFSHGVPTCVFSLALVMDGKPVAGVVYDPFMDRLVYAEKNNGAFLNNKRIHVSKLAFGPQTLIAVPLWANQLFIDPGKLVNLMHGQKTKTIDVGSIVYEGMLVAAGELAAALFTGKSSHDIAALKIIVEEAGGNVTDLYGREQKYNGPLKGAVISNGVTHPALLKLLKKAFIG